MASCLYKAAIIKHASVSWKLLLLLLQQGGSKPFGMLAQWAVSEHDGVHKFGQSGCFEASEICFVKDSSVQFLTAFLIGLQKKPSLASLNLLPVARW
jgi:hypothetical protein